MAIPLNSSLLVQVITAIVTWLVTGLIAYGAVKQDIALIKQRQIDQREFIEFRLNQIDHKLDTMYERDRRDSK